MAEQAQTKPSSSNIVMVGCKLPHGLHLQLYEDGIAEASKEKIKIKSGAPVTLKGANSSSIVGGFGLTEVRADFWDAWIKANANFPAVKNGLIFAEARRDRAADRAIDQATAKTGVEAIDPNKPAKGIDPVPEKELKSARAMGE